MMQVLPIPLSFQPLETIDFFSVSIDLLILHVHINANIQYVWLLPLSIISSRFIHIIAGARAPFLFDG